MFDKPAIPIIPAVVTDSSSATKVVEALIVIKRLAAKLESTKKALEKGHRAELKKIGTEYKKYAEPLAEKEARLKSALIEHEKLERDAAVAALQIESIDNSEIAADIVLFQRQEAVVEHPALSWRKSVTLEITKESAIPREYLIPDEKKIAAALKVGFQVPGAQLNTEYTPAIYKSRGFEDEA